MFSGFEPMFEFPFKNDSLSEPLIEFGRIMNLKESTVYYTGDAPAGVNIFIHALGSVGNVTIYNTGTRDIMKIDSVKLETLTGYPIKAGDDIIINTVKGQKSITLIRDGIATNILNCLDRTADWFQITKGDNLFTYRTDIEVTNLQFEITNKVLYEGI